jgi:hypothetical protein
LEEFGAIDATGKLFRQIQAIAGRGEIENNAFHANLPFPV